MSSYLKKLLILIGLLCGVSGTAEAIPPVSIGDRDISMEAYNIYEFENVKIFNGKEIRLEFVNNLYEGPGNDRNIYVDYVEIDDLAGTVIRVEVEDSTVTKSFPEHVISDAQASGSSAYAMLRDHDRLSFDFMSSNGSQVEYTVRIRARGDQYLGAPKLNLTVDSNEFINELLASGFVLPTSMAFLPDGHLLILQKCGKILIMNPDESPITTSTYMDLTPVTGCVNEQGIMDITLDPDFATNNYLYIYYRHAPSSRFRIARFTHPGGQTGDAASEVMIWQTDVSEIISHNGGALDFGPDGKLYVTTGDGAVPGDSQDLLSHSGKVMRVNKDGSIPTDNPFFDGQGGNARDEIWALGLRNPFRGRWDVNTNRFFISDVGGNDQQTAWEDVHLGAAGQNFGWPLCEGPCDNPDFPLCSCNEHDDPIFGYPHEGSGASISGGVVYRGNQFPSEYVGAYFYGDYVRGFIRYLTFDQTGLSVAGNFEFEPDAGAVVAIEEGPDGALYYLDIVSGSLHRISVNTSGNQAPIILQAEADVSAGPAPLTVNFTGIASDQESDDLVYEWTFGDGEKMIGQNSSHTYPFNGSYEAFLEVSDGINVTKSAPIAINVGGAPQATITSPIDGSLFRAGDQITFTGAAFDPDETLQGDAFSWTVEFGHNEHTHPGLSEVSGTSGTFDIPVSGHDFHDETSYIFTLTVTDSDGLRDTTSVQIFPDKVDVTFNSNPSGLTLFLDQIPIVTPLVYDTLIGFEHTVTAPATQCHNGISYQFDSWSTGIVSSTHTITVPANDQTFTANYLAVGSCQGPGLINNLTVGSGQSYEIVDLNSGAAMYIDRAYTFGSPIPAVLNGQKMIRPANDDKFSSTGDPAFLEFDVGQAVDVYILYTNQATTLEADWLNDGQGWALQGFTVPSSLPGNERDRLVRKKSFAAGPVHLPGNGSLVKISSMYHVVVTVQPSPPGELIDNLQVGSGESYEIVDLNSGAAMYIDRPYTFGSPIPAVLNGQKMIRPANDDKFSSTGDPAFLEFDVGQAVDVYILYTNQATTLEADWLNDGQGWALQGFTVPSSLPGNERDRLVRKKSFAAGPVHLPGNGSLVKISSMYHVVVTVQPSPPGELIDNLQVGSGESYEIVDLNSGAAMYIDRAYTFGSPIPAVLNGQKMIRPANDDKFSSTGDPAFLEFDVGQAVDVYILYTNQATTLEADWLNDGQGWALQGFTVPSSLPGNERDRLVRKKSFAAGPVHLPGNGSLVKISSMYHVVVVP